MMAERTSTAAVRKQKSPPSQGKQKTRKGEYICLKKGGRGSGNSTGNRDDVKVKGGLTNNKEER